MQSSIQSQPVPLSNADEVKLGHSFKPQHVEQGLQRQFGAKLRSEPELEQILKPGPQPNLNSHDIEREKGDTQTDPEHKEQEQEEQQTPEPPFSVFSIAEKRFIVIIASLAALFSPLSANIYYPALNTLSADLHVSLSEINFTITTYLVCYYYPMPSSRSSTERDEDISRLSTAFHWKSFGRGWSAASLPHLFHYLYRRQYWSSRAKELSYLTGPSHDSELRE
jgi:hypothetical protein